MFESRTVWRGQRNYRSDVPVQQGPLQLSSNIRMQDFLSRYEAFWQNFACAHELLQVWSSKLKRHASELCQEEVG